MKKTILLLAMVTILFACVNDKKEKEQDAEEIEAETEMAIEDMPILLGVQNRKTIQSKPYSAWFTKNYMYQPDQKSLAALNKSLDGISITIFMGTWCEDSQLQVPALYGILDAIKYDSEKVTLITVSEEKETPLGLEKGMDIQYVPTIILYKNGKELGRIVEAPVETLEADLVKIAKGEAYKHTYEE